MLFRNITIVDENFKTREHVYVGTDSDTISYISEKEPEKDYGQIFDGENRLLIPAFYNLHGHVPMTLMRGFGENLPLMDWLQKKIFPFEAQLTDEDMYNGAMLGIAEMLRYGIGATTEIYLRYGPLARALAESGIKANLSASITGDGDYKHHPMYRPTMDAIRDYEGFDNGRLHVEFALHAEYTSTEKLAKGLAEAALENHSSLHVHVAETRGETESCRLRHGGKSPVEYLYDCGFFRVPCVAAHCVYVSDEDIAILRENNVSVASCPKSNAKLADGICPAAKLLDAGVNVAIGTDSVASNNNLNMTEEMRFFSLLQKVSTGDPTRQSPAETLYAATRAGALAQHRDNCGLIKVGYKADLTVFDTDKVYMQPSHDLLNNLIYSASGNDVVLTMVDGKVLYRSGEYTTLDIELVRYNSERSLRRIMEKL